jgi:hypothetical protein
MIATWSPKPITVRGMFRPGFSRIRSAWILTTCTMPPGRSSRNATSTSAA